MINNFNKIPSGRLSSPIMNDHSNASSEGKSYDKYLAEFNKYPSDELKTYNMNEIRDLDESNFILEEHNKTMKPISPYNIKKDGSMNLNPKSPIKFSTPKIEELQQIEESKNQTSEHENIHNVKENESHHMQQNQLNTAKTANTQSTNTQTIRPMPPKYLKSKEIQISENQRRILIEINPKSPIEKAILERQVNFDNSDELDILHIVGNFIYDINSYTYELLSENRGKFKVSETRKHTDDILQKKDSLYNTSEKFYLKEMQNASKHQRKKLVDLQEQLMLLEREIQSTNSRNSLRSRFTTTFTTVRDKIVNPNKYLAKEHKIKEIKSQQDIIRAKIASIESEIQCIEKQKEVELKKSENLKEFLSNVESKHYIQARTNRNSYDRKMRYFSEQHRKIIERANKDIEIDYEEKERHARIREEQYQRHLEELREKSIKRRIFIDELKSKSLTKIPDRNQYVFAKFESEDSRLKRLEEEQLQAKLLETKLKKKSLLKPINMQELNEFSKNYDSIKEGLMKQKQQERRKNNAKIKEIIKKLPRPTTSHNRIVTDIKKEREKKVKEKLDKIYSSMKSKNFSNVVKEKLMPKIDESKRKEIQDRIEFMRKKPYIRKLDRSYGKCLYLDNRNHDGDVPGNHVGFTNNFKKFSRNNGTLDELPNTTYLKNDTIMERETFHALNTSSSIRRNTLNPIISKEPKHQITIPRKPLDKYPNYLVQSRQNREGTSRKESSSEKWKRMLQNKNHSLRENIEEVKLKAHILEEQAKEKEKFLSLNGGIRHNNDLSEDVSAKLLDAIQAKLAILELNNG